MELGAWAKKSLTLVIKEVDGRGCGPLDLN
jgi:hypothetical protein